VVESNECVNFARFRLLRREELPACDAAEALRLACRISGSDGGGRLHVRLAEAGSALENAAKKSEMLWRLSPRNAS
jgi:hypothetical protein